MSSLPTCPSQTLYFDKLSTENILQVFPPTFTPQPLPCLFVTTQACFNILCSNSDDPGTISLASFRFTENLVLRILLLQSAFPSVHSYLLHLKTFTPFLIFQTFQPLMSGYSSLSLVLFGGTGCLSLLLLTLEWFLQYRMPWFSHQHTVGCHQSHQCPLLHSHLTELSHLTTLICQIKG